MAKMKSPNYPAVGLSGAIESSRKLWSKEKRTAVTSEVAVKAMGYTSLNGATLTRLSALKKYGLVESEGKHLRVSQLGMTIIHSPEGSQERHEAILEAAMKPDLFRELAETHGDASDDALRSHLVLKKGFSDAGARNFVAAFRDTLALAKLSSSGYTEDKKSQEAEAMSGRTLSQSLGESVTVADESKRSLERPSMRVFSWPLSKEVSAEVRLTGPEIRPAHLERLRQYLELAKAAVGSDEEE